MTTALFHWDGRLADRLAPALGGDITVYVVGAFTVARYDTILIVTPPARRLETQGARDAYTRWLNQLPALLNPGREHRIFFL